MIVAGFAFVLCAGLAGLALADKLADFKAAAQKSGCEATPYSSEQNACKKQQSKKDSACRDFSCNRAEVERLLESLAEKRKNLADARSRNNRSAIPALEESIRKLEDRINERKAAATRRVQRCRDCIMAREKVQRVFSNARSRVERESDRALEPYIDKLVAHYDKGAQEHERPLEETKAALASCQWVSSIRY